MNHNNMYPRLQAKIIGYYSSKEAAKEIGIPISRLLHWKQLGIVSPKVYWQGRKKIYAYSEDDIKNATLINLLINTGNYTIERAIQRLRDLS